MHFKPGFFPETLGSPRQVPSIPNGEFKTAV